MTTIAWNNTEIAWDSQQTSGTDIKWMDKNKVRVKDGKIYALAGDPRVFEALIAWEKGGAVPDEFPAEQSDIIAVFFGEEVKVYMLGYPLTRVRDMYALGTGGDLAVIAMRAGLTPTAAVTLVADMDIYTGGPINSLQFADVLGAPEPRIRAIRPANELLFQKTSE
ncbi:MAG: hypothetical protein IPO08_18430 [Xanthomonadales bacterium]|nr:hypothetical protein [Xanthomonadales bacterium]